MVVLAGGTKDWSDTRLKDRRLNLFTIQNGQWSAVTDWGTASMGSADTLAKFVKYCWQTYPADRHVLILWDHGSCATDGLCFDELYNDDGLTIAELGSCFSDLQRQLSGFHLDVIGADACLMGCYEMAVTLAPYADYYVASEELEPWLGWYYTNWLKALDADPGISSRDLAVAIVDSYIYGCNRDDPNDYLTLSAIDLSKMPALASLVESLADTLTQKIGAGQFSTISRTVQSMYVFGNYDDAGSDMVDLSEFLTMCGQYDADTASRAQAALGEAVVYSYANSYVPKATGLSIYVPMETSDYVSYLLSDYASDAVSGYTGFVTAFSGAVSSGSWNFNASVTAPSQMTQNDYSQGFWSSLNGWGAVDGSGTYSGGWGNLGSGSVYGSGYGYNTANVTIAGSAGTASATTTPAATAAATQGTGGVTIAGSASATATPEATTGTGVVTIAGTQTTAAPTATAAPDVTAAASTPEVTAAPQSTAPVVQADLTGTYAFSLQLSEEDLRNLSYAELLLYQDFSDENGWDLDELGCVRDTWIDWENGTVYSLFDGTWPTLGDVAVVMYEQSRTDYARRCIIPVMLNDTTRTYLVVEYLSGAQEGTILGTSEGWTENGLPVRGITPLTIGDRISPIYPSYSSSDTSPDLTIDQMSGSWTVYDDEEFVTVWDGTQTIGRGQLTSDCSYKMAFRLHDIYGGSTTSAFITFRVSE